MTNAEIMRLFPQKWFNVGATISQIKKFSKATALTSDDLILYLYKIDLPECKMNTPRNMD